MNENEMTQEQQDAAVIRVTRRLHEDNVYLGGNGKFDEFVSAALREIDRLRARAAAYDVLREAVQSAIVGLEVAGDFNLVAAALNERDNLRAALAPTGDATTGRDGNARNDSDGGAA